MMASASDNARPREATRVHTGILRLALGTEESRAYWSHVDPSVPPGPRAIQAFEQRWFGGKSLHRVRTLLAYLGARYDAFPAALEVLHTWPAMDPTTRQLICHWHLQLADPLYRRFSGDFLVQRRQSMRPELQRDVVVRWIAADYAERWNSATTIQFASKLLSAARGAGLITPSISAPKPVLPKVGDRALEYLLHLLRELSFEGSLTDNPYLASVGLGGALLKARLSGLPSIRYQQLADAADFGWKYPSLSTWAQATP